MSSIKYEVEVFDSGHIEWKLNRQLHREDGPAIEYANGNKVWYINGKLHREDGPAIQDSDGYKTWYVNGKKHRLDGPAVECSNGDREWFIEGKRYYTEDKFNEEIAKLNNTSCNNKLIEIEGKKYRLVEEE